jgi:hypothetical protein
VAGLVSANCFWDMGTSGQVTSGIGTGKTTAEMQDDATFTDTSTMGLTAAWDFVGDPHDDTGTKNIWDIHASLNGGYPRIVTITYVSTQGITVVSQLAATSSIVGETYGEALTNLSLYDVSGAGDATQRYGELLLDSSRTFTSDITNATWCAGGTYLGCSTAVFTDDLTVNDVIMVADGSKYTNCRYGTHFYTVQTLDATSITLYERDPSCAVSDTDATPADVSFTAWDPDGRTYAECLEIVRTKNVLVTGTNDGHLYYLDGSLAGDWAGLDMPSRHLTPIFDGKIPGQMKVWPGVRVTARKRATTKSGQLLVYYRIGAFDTSTGWTRCDTTWSLDATWTTREFWINRTSKKIQFALMDSSGSTFEVSEIGIMEPAVEENR